MVSKIPAGLVGIPCTSCISPDDISRYTNDHTVAVGRSWPHKSLVPDWLAHGTSLYFSRTLEDRVIRVIGPCTWKNRTSYSIVQWASLGKLICNLDTASLDAATAPLSSPLLTICRYMEDGRRRSRFYNAIYAIADLLFHSRCHIREFRSQGLSLSCHASSENLVSQPY